MDPSWEEVLGVTAVGAAGYLLLRGIYTAYLSPKDFRARIQCACGNFVADLHVPFGSRIVTPTNCYCCCEDCVGFAEYVAAKKKPVPGQNMVISEKFPAVHMVQFYQCDVTVLEGMEQLQACRLHKTAQCYRYYTK